MQDNPHVTFLVRGCILSKMNDAGLKFQPLKKTDTLGIN